MLDHLTAAVPPDVRVGVTDLRPFDSARATIEERIASGHSGGLGFVYRDGATASNPHTSFPWAQSIVVAAVPYLIDGDGVAIDEVRLGTPIARFAATDRYVRVRSTTAAIAALLEDAGHRCEVVFDDDRLIDRAVAVRAGLGWYGTSTMVINPAVGPWFLIGSVVTDAELEPTPPMTRGCGTCTACVPACPTDAIVAPGVLDARRCLAAVLQRPGVIPRPIRPSVGRRIYGCDACLVACPPGDKAVGGLTVRPAEPSPSDVLAASDTEILTLATHWYIPKRNPRFVRRNALVAAGNVGSGESVPLLAAYAGHPDALLRIHAVWALRTIGGPAAIAVVDQVARTDADARVVAEATEPLP
ncbi:MAG: HEAT repeat domain-containing protein [Acidimicrobiia bacterium]|nr:HEAT repeat domain-containing protein [Acidimicrobiia bacterium]